MSDIKTERELQLLQEVQSGAAAFIPNDRAWRAWVADSLVDDKLLESRVETARIYLALTDKGAAALKGQSK